MENIKIAVITPDRDYGRALGLALVDVSCGQAIYDRSRL